MHWQQWSRRDRQPTGRGLVRKLASEFLFSLPLAPDSCWIWPGNTYNGYGRYGGRNAHRVVWEMLIGPLTADLDHCVCFNKLCVNPAHLQEVSRSQHTKLGLMRGQIRGAATKNRSKTHCKQGHPFDAANTYWYSYGESQRRMCRTCSNERTRRYKQEQRGRWAA